MEETNTKQKHLETLKTLLSAASGEPGNAPNREDARVALEYAIRELEGGEKQQQEGDEFRMSAEDHLARILQGRGTPGEEWLDAGALKLSRMMNDEASTPATDSDGARWLAEQVMREDR